MNLLGSLLHILVLNVDVDIINDHNVVLLVQHLEVHEIYVKLSEGVKVLHIDMLKMSYIQFLVLSEVEGIPLQFLQ